MDVCGETVDLVGEDGDDGEKVICEMKQEVDKTEQNVDYNTGQSMEEGNEDTSNQQPLNLITEGVKNSNAEDAMGSKICAKLSVLYLPAHTDPGANSHDHKVRGQYSVY